MNVPDSRQLPSAQEVESGSHESVEKDILSGEILFGLHDEYPFTRPGLPVRQFQALEAAGARPGSATRAVGNLIITLASLVDAAGRQPKPEHKAVAKIGTYMMALEIAEFELDKMPDNQGDISAQDMSQRIEANYSDWATCPPDYVDEQPDGTTTILITAAMVQSGLSLLQEKLSAEASAVEAATQPHEGIL